METKEAIVLFESKELREVIIDGEKWLSAVDVAECLGYSNPSRDISGLMSRQKERFEGVAKVYTLSTRGGNQGSWVINLEGVIMLCMISHTDKAIPFQKWAVKELKKIIGNIPSNIELGIKRKRVLFTDELRDHGLTKPYEYINVTKSMKKHLDIDQNKKKENCDLIEKMKIAAAEDIARINIMQSNPIGYHEVKPVCDNSAEVVRIGTAERKYIWQLLFFVLR